MGMTYKGGSPTWRSISQNAEALKNEPQYHFAGGFFGPRHRNSRDSHDLYFDDPVSASKSFYDKIAYGGIERKLGPGHWLTEMKDGTFIDYRVITSSKGSPAVLINVKKSKDNGGIEYHKVHFSKTKGGK